MHKRISKLTLNNTYSLRFDSMLFADRKKDANLIHLIMSFRSPDLILNVLALDHVINDENVVGLK